MKRWLSVILMMGLILALNPLGAQARRSSHGKHHPKYHHHHGKSYGWDGPRHHAYDRHHKEYFLSSWRGPHRYRHYVHYAGPPSAVYAAPVAPMVEIPYSQPQPFYFQPAAPGFSQEFMNF